MKNLIRITFIAYLLFNLMFVAESHRVFASVVPVESTSNLETELKKPFDWREQALSEYLAKHNSPLKDHSRLMIRLADQYELPWNLLAAIAGVESTFCKKIPYNSYNCWGWANGEKRFTSYQDALETISRSIRATYYNRGLDTPEKMHPTYAPPSKTWGGNVRFFMNQIEASSE